MVIFEGNKAQNDYFNSEMANKRDLKKKVNSLCGDLFAECVACVHYAKVNRDDADAVMVNILNMQDDILCRISHIEPGLKACLFFKKLNGDLKEQTENIIAQIEALA